MLQLRLHCSGVCETWMMNSPSRGLDSFLFIHCIPPCLIEHLSPRQTPPEQKKFQNEYRIHFYQIITFNFQNFFQRQFVNAFVFCLKKLIGETIYYNTKTWKKPTTYELNNFLHDYKFLIA